MAETAARRRIDAFSYIDDVQADLCRVALAKDWKAELVGTNRELDRTLWLRHKRDARTREQEKELKPGKFVQVSLELAEAFFGCFSIPILDKVNRAESEHVRKGLAERFAMTKAHAIVKWGDFPRLSRAGQGMTYEPLGPARFPDVVVTILPGEEPEDANDPRFKPVRLRALYGLGDYVDMEHLVSPSSYSMRKAAQEEDGITRADFAAALGDRDRISKLEGQLETLLGIINADPELKARVAKAAPTAATTKE